MNVPNKATACSKQVDVMSADEVVLPITCYGCLATLTLPFFLPQIKHMQLPVEITGSWTMKGITGGCMMLRISLTAHMPASTLQNTDGAKLHGCSCVTSKNWGEKNERVGYLRACQCFITCKYLGNAERHLFYLLLTKPLCLYKQLNKNRYVNVTLHVESMSALPSKGSWFQLHLPV